MNLRPFQSDPLIKAAFVDRPNRFLVRCRLPHGEVVEAHMPNPGRMWELLLPEATLYLAPAAKERKTRYTALAVERDGRPVFLHTHWTNRVARFLIENRLVPGLKRARVRQAEVTVGRSRFDLLLERVGKPLYLEVKSCTLFGERVAMFPDAVTARGRKHLLHLAELSDRGAPTAVMFLIQTPLVDWFMPDYHTDLAFSQALLDARGRVAVYPVAIQWRPDLSLSPEVKRVRIPWAHVRREAQDRGAYLLILALRRAARIQVGGLGVVEFPPGFYVYVGSAMRNLSARVNRHLRRRKRMRWHIDYLRACADEAEALPIRSSRREECDIAAAMAELLPGACPGFGASDCACPTHLFYSPAPPLQSPAFHALLQRFRLRAP